MGACRLLAVKLGFQWHKATGEPIVATPISKPLGVPPDSWSSLLALFKLFTWLLSISVL